MSQKSSLIKTPQYVPKALTSDSMTFSDMANADRARYRKTETDAARVTKANSIIDHYSEHPVHTFVDVERDNVKWVDDFPVVVIPHYMNSIQLLNEVVFDAEDEAKNKKQLQSVIRKIAMPSSASPVQRTPNRDDGAYNKYDEAFSAA